MADGDGDGDGCLGRSIDLFNIWKIWMYAFVIGLPYVREGIFFVCDWRMVRMSVAAWWW